MLRAIAKTLAAVSQAKPVSVLCVRKRSAIKVRKDFYSVLMNIQKAKDVVSNDAIIL